MAGVRVWDPLVRLLHWGLVAGVGLAWLTHEAAEDAADAATLGPHQWIGLGVAALVAVRVLWGLLGPRHARFAGFVRAPAAVARYARQVLSGKAPRHLGHNPLGGWMIVALLATLAGTAATGWLMTTDAFFGSEGLEELHEALANALLPLVGLHVAGVVLTGRHQRENLVRAMLTGRKRAAAADDVD